jgi:GNAT superfamily N-acetyltransferase
MQDSYRVVPASSGHISALPSIERSAAELFGDAVPAELLEHVTDEAAFLDSQRIGTLWVALGPDDEPVGFARVDVAGAQVHLAELDVLPAHGRRGVGTALIQAVEAWARSRNCTQITLTTYRELPWNAPFYARLGFSVVPETEWDTDMRRRFEEEAGLQSERAKRVVMRKRLGSA